ncbi:cytochrome c oxidase subunit 2 [Nitrosospira briensis]|uniref:Cytochrome aa3 subunit 2 n=1 Tax=Nitrosospira briensis TaxID=35799 RepID=A0A1I5AJT4_9PROT|nr:cytochrome c oxidase subunit II [Nitrosospira briensis]SFN62766.1 cytochrome c oxidase subunit 2 [Nitrosospira briensis]
MKTFKPGFYRGPDAPCAGRLIALAVVSTATMTGTATAGEAPLNYFLHSHGPASRPTMYLGWVLAGLSVAVCLIIALLLITAMLRKRPAADSRVIGQESGGLRWIYIGTGISTCILAGLVVYSLMVLNNVANPPTAPAITLTVTGYDWWWKIEYDHPESAKRFITANEIHVPVGQPVLLKLKSADVIHAFWVPKLAGKTQLIPGLINQKWIQADEAGIYSGQCSQFCGVGHAHMGFEVVAESANDFQKWQEEQLRTVSPSPAGRINAGYKLFLDRCAGCHTIRGTDAAGEHGPDLTHLNSRRRLAGGLLANTPDDLMDWITRAQKHKPGSRMPSMVLSDDERSVLALFLSTLD